MSTRERSFAASRRRSHRAVPSMAVAPERRGGIFTCVWPPSTVTPDMRRQCLALGASRVFDKSHDLDALIQYCSEQALGHRAQDASA